jgi:HAD superfamily hydrolase (TIGR01509 family)
MIKAILFDLDGVLVDAKKWHYEALNHALEPFNCTISLGEHFRKFDGLPTKIKLDMLTREYGLPSDSHEQISLMKQIYTLNKIKTNCRPLAIHQYAIKKLKFEGYKLAVCSNSVRETLVTAMDRADLTQYFDCMLSNQDVQNAKPDPEIYNLAMKQLDFVAEECLIVEDNENGIKSALASGAHLLKVDTVYDVTYDNIKNKITTIERSEK